MLRDYDNNTVFIADALWRYPRVMEALQAVCKNAGIKTRLIMNTDNIWCRDYMPVQTPTGFVKFRYKSGLSTYELKKYPQLHVPDDCWGFMGDVHESDIVLDGGNVVRHGDRVIMTDIVFWHNRRRRRSSLLKQLEKELQAQVILIPKEPLDTLGHADGMVKFVSTDEVLVNDYHQSKFRDRLYDTINRAQLKATAFPWADYKSNMTEVEFRHHYPNADDFNPGVGYYINFLVLKGIVIVPGFGFTEDKRAIVQLQREFSGFQIVQIPCFDLAMEGGLLNCVTACYQI